MSVPKSVVKIDKDGVTFTSAVDRAEYLIGELSRAALRDAGKYIVKVTRDKIRARRRRRGASNYARQTQYWVRRKEADLIVGLKKKAFWGMFFELGTREIPKWGFLTQSTESNIDEIRRIEGAYLSAIEDENRALGLIDEEEYIGDENE